MVGETGFEPATLCSQNRCATRLRYSPNELAYSTYIILFKEKNKNFGYLQKINYCNTFNY